MSKPTRVTVIFPDNAICVDDEWLSLDALAAPDNARVIQWHVDGEKHIEHADGSPNTKITSYPKQVQPYVDLFDAERQRRLAIENAPPTEEEQLEAKVDAIRAELAAIDADSVRPLRAHIAGTATDADKARLVELESRAAELRVELAALGLTE